MAYVQEVHGISQRRACSLLGADRTSIRYRAQRPDDAPVRARLRNGRPSAAGLAIGGWASCWCAKARD